MSVRGYLGGNTKRTRPLTASINRITSHSAHACSLKHKRIDVALLIDTFSFSKLFVVDFNVFVCKSDK